jgi:hypothetical protein
MLQDLNLDNIYPLPQEKKWTTRICKDRETQQKNSESVTIAF